MSPYNPRYGSFGRPTLAEAERDARECAPIPCPPELAAEIDETFADAFGICSRIARTQAAKQELATVTVLRPRTGNVSNVVPIRKTTPAAHERPGA